MGTEREGSLLWKGRPRALNPSTIKSATFLLGREQYYRGADQLAITITITILSPDQLACAPQALGETGRVVYLSTY